VHRDPAIDKDGERGEFDRYHVGIKGEITGYGRVNCTSGKEEDERICENMEFGAYVPEPCYH